MNGSRPLDAVSVSVAAHRIGSRFGGRCALPASRPLDRTPLEAGERPEGGDRLLRWAVGCVAAFAVAWMASGALPAAGERSGEAAGIPVPSDLEFARVLLGAGRPAHALAFLRQAEPADERDRVERHLLLGRVHMLLGNPEEAAENYEAVLAARPEMTPVRLEAARVLLEAGRPGHALAFLEQAEPADERDRLERHLLLGRAHMLLGSPGEAAENYETVLAVRPEMTSIRLEAARANFLAGKDRRAKRHFRRVAKDELPEHVEAAVARYLAEIERRKPWSATLSASLLPETNTVRRTDRETVEIGGIPFRLNEDARESSGIGIRIGLGGTLTPVLSDSARGHLSLSLAGKLYENTALNDVSVTGRIGMTRQRERGPASGGLQFGRRWAGGDGFRRRAGIWARAETRRSPRVRTGLETEFEYRKHDDSPDRDGWRAALLPSVRVALSERTLLVVDANLERADARAAHHATLTARLAATVARTFGNGFSASGSVSVKFQNHGGPDPLFEKTRKDRTLGIDGRLYMGAWRVAGFSPYLGYSYERNMSNLELHGYQNHSVDIGVSRSF